MVNSQYDLDDPVVSELIFVRVFRRAVRMTPFRRVMIKDDITSAVNVRPDDQRAVGQSAFFTDIASPLLCRRADLFPVRRVQLRFIGMTPP
jgi:hypothetical protein